MKEICDVGLVLSGGGARGVAHAGAIVGALYATGYGPEGIVEFFRRNANIFRWKYIAPGKPGILDTDKYAEVFEPWLHGHTFESLGNMPPEWWMTY